jgi:hypothetical protein
LSGTAGRSGRDRSVFREASSTLQWPLIFPHSGEAATELEFDGGREFRQLKEFTNLSDLPDWIARPVITLHNPTIGE